MSRIQIDRLHKTFHRHVAVRDLDLTIENGELLVLLGPSGCGKTTTLNCIAGLETPTSGRVLFDDEDVTAASPHQRNIAMVFQSSLLYPHMTARQNIRTSLAKQKLDRAETDRRISEASSILGIEALLDKLPSQLSGGERQRVATAKAIVRQPTAFLLDEPLAALDAALRLTLRAELVNLQKRLGTTMIVVTHDQVEAMTMGDRIAVMNDGRLEQIGTPDEIYNRPATLFVAGFVGSPPMNLIEGEIVTQDGRTRFVSRDLTFEPKLAAGDAGPATLGIRPQHLHIHAEGRNGAVPVTVFAVEHLGRESVVILEDGGRNKLHALVEPGFAGRVGDRLHAAPDPTHCLLFDRAGSVLSHAAAE
ncbi:MAG: ABC transporter ATP-binding protein [Rhodospirillales bacterium]|nr:ABC transporter ATP-binding protein [Rhodospirillales bacterium]